MVGLQVDSIPFFLTLLTSYHLFLCHSFHIGTNEGHRVGRWTEKNSHNHGQGWTKGKHFLNTNKRNRLIRYSKKKPLVISSNYFTHAHTPNGFHSENPLRIGKSLKIINEMKNEGKIQVELLEQEQLSTKEGMEKALTIIKEVHSPEYVKEIEMECNARKKNNYSGPLTPFDRDTYATGDTFQMCVLAQYCWLQAIDAVLEKSNPSMAFALTRPPGHHAGKQNSQGFCIFNFCVGAAHYALTKKTQFGRNVEKIAILDFDVHHGNGVASLVKNRKDIRYCSLHQLNIFPGTGEESDEGGPDVKNMRNIGLGYNCALEGDESCYRSLLAERALPFLFDDANFQPDLLIVSAGYDAMASDQLASVNLFAEDYGEIASMIKEKTEKTGIPTIYGLEGGYSLEDLPKAIESTLQPYC